MGRMSRLVHAAVTALVECYSHMKELSEKQRFCLLKSRTVLLSAHTPKGTHVDINMPKATRTHTDTQILEYIIK